MLRTLLIFLEWWGGIKSFPHYADLCELLYKLKKKLYRFLDVWGPGCLGTIKNYVNNCSCPCFTRLWLPLTYPIMSLLYPIMIFLLMPAPRALVQCWPKRVDMSDTHPGFIVDWEELSDNGTRVHGCGLGPPKISAMFLRPFCENYYRPQRSTTLKNSPKSITSHDSLPQPQTGQV